MATYYVDTKSPKQLERLFKDLAELDVRRRNILREIKMHPKYCIKMIENSFASLHNSPRWFITNDKDGQPLPIELRKNAVISFDKTPIQIEPLKDGRYEVNYKVKYLYGSVLKHRISVSVDRPLIPQFTQNLTELTEKELKAIEKEIQQIEAEKLRKQKIDEVEAKIKELQTELNKLKK